MSLISCPECSREISDKALSCPYCGFPLSADTNAAYSSNQYTVNVISPLTSTQKELVAKRLEAQNLMQYPVAKISLNRTPGPLTRSASADEVEKYRHIFKELNIIITVFESSGRSSASYIVSIDVKPSDTQSIELIRLLVSEKLLGEHTAPYAVSRLPGVLTKGASAEAAQKYREIGETLGLPVSIQESGTESAIESYGSQGQVCCPRCHSSSIQVVKKGFSFGKAAVGTLLFGSVGAVAGLASNKYQRVCAACGHKW